MTSRLSLPEQNIREGKIVFKVYEGSVEDVFFVDKDKVSPVKTGESFLLPFGQGDLLNLRDLEQGAENINRLKSQRNNPGHPSNFSIATAWNRMRSGGTDLATRQRDMLLLKHEVAEIRIKQQIPSIDHTEAHRLTNDRYNWEETVPWVKLGF